MTFHLPPLGAGGQHHSGGMHRDCARGTACLRDRATLAGDGRVEVDDRDAGRRHDSLGLGVKRGLDVVDRA